MDEVQLASPVGTLVVVADDDAIVAVRWGRGPEREPMGLLRETAEQLDAYFAGRLKEFDLPLRPRGGTFQRQVCDAMLAIPYGMTRTYGELATRLDSAAQAIGQACGENSIPIIIPCHRVLAAQGLGGYSGAGGIETKIALLKLEGGFPYLL
ncbi:MAG: methylated-DNA--[protein]-cysteine S-methyltransferase [Pseudomonadota bacterium]